MSEPQSSQLLIKNSTADEHIIPELSEVEWAELPSSREPEFRCIMSSADGVMETLECQAANSNLGISIMAFGRARTDALNILETSD